MVADTRVGSADTGDRDRAAATGGQRTRRGKVDSEVISRIAASPGQSDTPVRSGRGADGGVDVDSPDIGSKISARVPVEEDVPGRGDRIVDVNVAALDGDWPLDVQGRLEQDAGGVGRAAEGQAGQGVGQDEPIG